MQKITLINIIIVFLSMNYLTACTSYESGILNGDLNVIAERRFPISPGNDLRIKVSGGDVIINSWDRSEVYIKVLGNDNAVDKIDFIFNNSETFVELKTEKKGSMFNWLSNISLKIEVMVPERFNSNIHTSGGDIELVKVDGRSELNTSGGDVNCRDFLGSLDVSTSGGDIKLRGGNTPIVANTSGGDIRLDYFGENKGIDLSTSGGDIIINIPHDFNADMELSTSGGDVSCNLTMNNASKLSGHKIVAELNEGGSELVAHTSGGDIDVRKQD